MHRLVTTIVLAVCIAAAPPALLGIDPGPEIWVDGPAAKQPGVDPIFPDVAVDEEGRRVYVWNDDNGAPQDDDVYLRRFDADGSPLEDPRLVNTLTDDEQTNPRVAVAPDGSFLVVWQSREHDADVDNTRRWVRGQAFAANGDPVGSEQLLSEVSPQATTDNHADVAALRSTDGASAGYVVVWESRNSTGDDTNDSIQGRIVSANGVPVGSQFQVNSEISGNQRAPAVTELADGGFLVTWVIPELSGRRFTASGAAVGSDFQISTEFSGQKLDPDAAIGWAGEVLVVWMDAEGGSDREIRARLFARDLTPLGGDFRVNSLSTNEQSGPRVADLGPAGFLVAWESETSVGADLDDSIQARVITGPGAFEGPQFQMNDYQLGHQEFPGASGRYGRAGVAWQSNGNETDANNTNITGRLIEVCLFCDDVESGSTSRWSAGSAIDVLGDAAYTGSFGFRVTLSACANTGTLTLSGTVATDQCTQDDIVTSGSTTVDGDVTFTGGTSIALDDGFSTADGASFTAIVDPGVAAGTAFLQDDTPGAEPRYVAQYRLDAGNMTVDDGKQFDQFVAYDETDVEQFRVVVTHNGVLDEDRVYVEARNDDGTFASTGAGNELLLPTGYNAIEVDWAAASSAGTSDGAATICVNDDGARTNCQSLAHDHAGQIDYVRWGVPEIGDCTNCGSIDLDDFVSRRTGPIGF